MTALAGVLAIWALAVVSPGPAFLVVSQTAAGRSRAAALGVALGIASGAAFYASLTMWGLGVLVVKIAWLGTVLRTIGAVYLLYLGVSLLRSSARPPAASAGADRSAGDVLGGMRTGLVTALTNPKGIAFFLSLFAVALPADLTFAGKLALLACGFAIELGWYVFVAMTLSAGWPRRQYARARKTIERVLGAALVLAGVRLAALDP
jgi:threonine/homoserine/homoserine lactone efflux protein